MSLYKMELYKICHRKIFIIGSISVVLLLILYFWFVGVGDEIATVEGVRYKGYEAVQMDREVTEKYSGVLTDDKGLSDCRHRTGKGRFKDRQTRGIVLYNRMESFSGNAADGDDAWKYSDFTWNCRCFFR